MKHIYKDQIFDNENDFLEFLKKDNLDFYNKILDIMERRKNFEKKLEKETEAKAKAKPKAKPKNENNTES